MRTRIVAVLAVLALAAGCVSAGTIPSARPEPSPSPPSPTTTVVPTATVAPEPVEWTYVSFGDSVIWTIDNTYRDALEDALGVEIEIVDRTTPGSTSETLLKLLTGTSDFSQVVRDEVAVAQVVTVEIPTHELEEQCGMGENTAEETAACMTRARDLIGPNAEAILDAIADARGGRPGIVRVILPHRFFWDAFVEQGLDDVAGEQWDRMNERTAAAAREHGFLVLDLGTVLMGPNRDQDPMATGLVVDGIHLTDEGTARAVEALLELGLDDAPPAGG